MSAIKYITSTVAFLIVIGCQDVKRPEMPTNLISKDIMAEIFTEAYLMNAARSIDNRTIVGKGIILDSILYTKYKVDSLQFAKSNAFYSSDLETYKMLLLQVQENLTIEKAKRDTLYAQYKRSQEAIRIKDSIREARLDSMELVFPKLERDSLFQLLKTADAEALSKIQKISSKE